MTTTDAPSAPCLRDRWAWVWRFIVVPATWLRFGVLLLSGYHALAAWHVWRGRALWAELPLCGGWPYLLGQHGFWAALWLLAVMLTVPYPRRGGYTLVAAAALYGLVPLLEGQGLCYARPLRETWANWLVGWGFLMALCITTALALVLVAQCSPERPTTTTENFAVLGSER